MLWTAFIVLLLLWLMGFSIQAGSALIHLLLAVGFGAAAHQPAVRVPNVDLIKVAHLPA